MFIYLGAPRVVQHSTPGWSVILAGTSKVLETCHWILTGAEKVNGPDIKSGTIHTEVNVSAPKLRRRRRYECSRDGATGSAVACVTRQHSSEAGGRTLLLPGVHFLESSSLTFSCHRELCVPCLPVRNHVCFLCNVCFREGWRSVPVLLCGSNNDNSTADTVQLEGSTSCVQGTINTTADINVTKFKHATTGEVCTCQMRFSGDLFFGLFLPRHISYFFYPPGWWSLSDRW